GRGARHHDPDCFPPLPPWGERGGETGQHLPDRVLEDAGAEAALLLLVAGGDGGLGVVAVAVGAARAVAVRRVGPEALAGLGGQAGNDRGVALVALGVVVVVGADVAGLLGALALLVVGLQDGGLDDLAAGGVDRVGDVGVELGPAVGVPGGPVL